MWRAHSFMISIKCRTKAFSMESFSKWRYSHFFNVKRSLLFIKCRFLHVALFCKRSMSVYALNNLCMCLYCIRWSHGVIIFHMLSFSTHFCARWMAKHTHTKTLTIYYMYQSERSFFVSLYRANNGWKCQRRWWAKHDINTAWYVISFALSYL